MFETLIFIGTIVLTQIFKKYVYPRFGSTGIHVLTFIIAAIGLAVYQYAKANADFMNIAVMALNYLAGAIAIYEVLLKKIGVKSVIEKIQEENDTSLDE